MFDFFFILQKNSRLCDDDLFSLVYNFFYKKKACYVCESNKWTKHFFVCVWPVTIKWRISCQNLLEGNFLRNARSPRYHIFGGFFSQIIHNRFRSCQFQHVRVQHMFHIFMQTNIWNGMDFLFFIRAEKNRIGSTTPNTHAKVIWYRRNAMFDVLCVPNSQCNVEHGRNLCRDDVKMQLRMVDASAQQQ